MKKPLFSKPSRIIITIAICFFVLFILSLNLVIHGSILPRFEDASSQTVPLSINDVFPTPSSSPLITPEPSYSIPSGNKYQNSHISFQYPEATKLEKPATEREFLEQGVTFIAECEDTRQYRAIVFLIQPTNEKEPRSFVLGKPNEYAPSNQISRKTVIANIPMGINIEPVGDGSGGYEPKVTVDFLSRSRQLHYYLIALKGCRNSAEETYQTDLLPLLKTVKLFD